MVLSFSGDPFLAPRAARRALREHGYRAGDVTELGEGMDAAMVAQLTAQAGLFGPGALLLDFDAAFRGQSGVKPRNEVLEALAGTPEERLVAVIDLEATASRQKRYQELGEHRHLPTPRFGALDAWVRGELRAAGLRFAPDVPGALIDLFGEDLPGIAGEIAKLSVLGEELSAERVRAVAGRLAARDAFDLIEAATTGRAGEALAVCRSLFAQGEAPQRALGALTWQFDLVARCVAMRESRSQVGAAEVASTLGVRPFVAKKALAIAARLDEARLRQALAALLAADRAMKSGGDEHWALESASLELSRLFSKVA